MHLACSSRSDAWPSRVAVVVHALHGGGAERTAATLADHWAECGVRVTLITLSSVASDVYTVRPQVGRVGLDLMRNSQSSLEAFHGNVLRVCRLRRAIRNSNASLVISLTDKMNVTTLIACSGLRVGVIIAERTDPRCHEIGRVWSWLRRRVYRYCRSLVVQTESVRAWARPLVGRKPIYVVPNATRVSSAELLSVSPASTGSRRIAALGRLAREKGFDLLLAAFQRVADKHPGWVLEIHGEGDQRHVLEEIRREYRLEDRVSLNGWLDRPEVALHGADLFVLPSRYEGFPNALLEAMAQGLPCISFDCESGPREIIRHGLDGMLVTAEDVAAMACALDQLMSDECLRKSLGERAREVIRRFSQALFFHRWDAVLAGLAESEVAALTEADTAHG